MVDKTKQAKYIAAIARAKAAGDDEAVAHFVDKLSKGRPANEVQQEYSNAPWYQKAPQGALDVTRQFAEGTTAGHLSEASAGLSSVFGGDYDTEKALEDARLADSRTRAPGAGFAAEALGTLAPAKAIYGGVKGMLSPVAHAADEVPYLGKIAKPIAERVAGVGAGGVTGATVGGATAQGKGTNIPEGAAVGMLTGKLTGPSPIIAPGAIAAAIQALLSMKPRK